MNDFKVDLFPLFSLGLCHTLYQKVKLTKPKPFFLGKRRFQSKKEKDKKNKGE
jgi:hypothetical protein